MSDQDLPLASLASSSSKRRLSESASINQRKPKVAREIHNKPIVEGHRPRNDENPPKVNIECLPCWPEIDTKDPPPQTAKPPAMQSKEITVMEASAKKKGKNIIIPIGKNNRGDFRWVGQMRGAPGCYTISPDNLESAPRYRDSDNKCDICGNACGELFVFRAFRPLPPLHEGSSADDKAAREERKLLPFISYVSVKCGKNLLGQQNELSAAMDFVMLHLAKSEDNQAAMGELVESISKMGERKSKIYLRAMKMVVERSTKKLHQQRQAAGGPVNHLRVPKRPEPPSAHRFSGYSKEDKVIDPTRLETSYVAEVLWQLSWPICTTRQNVTPDGQAFILAFPIGLVQNYCYGPAPSATLSKFPKLSALLLRWFREANPDFKFTTIQLNRNYAAKLHVDGNNFGRSRIIGIPGPNGYEGGELWIYDPEIDPTDPAFKEMEVGTDLKGWPELRSKERVKGRLVSIKNTWFEFDGTVPHCVLPFTGERISLVFFSRNNWMNVQTELSSDLQAKGFSWPDENWCGGLKLEAIHGKQVKERLSVAGKRTKVEVSDDEENDEDDDGAFVPPLEDWCKILLASLECRRQEQPEHCPEPLTLVSAHIGISAFFGLRELCGTETLKTLGVAELKRDASKNILDKAAEPAKFSIGNKIKGLEEDGSEDIFCGSFLMLPFLTRTINTEGKPFFETDPYFETFRQMKLHLQTRRPRAALVVPDMRGIPREEVRATCRCVLEQLDLSETYHLEIAQVSAEDFGMPLDEQHVMIVAIRKDLDGVTENSASDALAIVHYIAKRHFLEWTPVQDFLWPEDKTSSVIQDTLRSWRKGTEARKEKENLFRRARKFLQHVKEHGIDREVEQYGEEWLPNAFDIEKQKALLVKKIAIEEDRADATKLIIDVWSKDDAWDDKGFLPRHTGNAWHYLVNRQRMLSGVEHLALRGVPARRVPDLVRINSDESLVTLACRTVPVPIVGAALLGVLLTTEMGRARGLVLREELWAEARQAIPTGPHEITKATLQKLLPEEVTQSIDSRALQLGFLLNHAGLKKEEKEKKKRQETEKAKGQKTEDAVKSPSPEDEIQQEDIKMKEELDDDGDSDATWESESEDDVADEELTDDWEKRSKLLMDRPPAFEKADIQQGVIYIEEALNQMHRAYASDIAVYGVDYLRRNLLAICKEDRDMPASLTRAFPNIEAGIAAKQTQFGAGVPEVMEIVSDLFRACTLQATWRQKKGGLCLDSEDRFSWPRYKAKVQHFTPWERYVCLQKALTSSKCEEFMQEVGAEMAARFLDEVPQYSDDLKEVATSVDLARRLLRQSRSPMLIAALHRQLFHRVADGKEKAKLLAALETESLQAAMTSLAVAIGATEAEEREPHILTLKMLSGCGGEVGVRFEKTLKLVNFCIDKLPALRNSSRSDGIHAVRAQKEMHEHHNIQQTSPLWRPLDAKEGAVIEALLKKEEADKREADRKEEQDKRDALERGHRDKLERAVRQVVSRIGKVEEHIQILKAKPEDGERALLNLVTLLAQDVFKFENSTEAFRQAVIARCCQTTMDALHKAAADVAKGPARIQKVLRWLRSENFGPILPALRACFDARSFVECLAESPTNCSPPVGLPEAMRQSLMNKVASLPRDYFDISDYSDLPSGWSQRVSNSSGMTVYSKDYHSQFMFPYEETSNEHRPVVPVPSYGTGLARDGVAPYIDFDAIQKSKVLCSLCEKQGILHLHSKEHRNSLDFWALFVNVVKDVKEEMVKMDLKPTVQGLGDIWQFYLLNRLQDKVKAIWDSNEGDPTQTFRTFWHRIVLRCWQAAGTSREVIPMLNRIVEQAELPEPRLHVPKAGRDFVYLPPRGEVFAQFSSKDSGNNFSIDQATAIDFLGEALRPLNEKTPEGETIWRCDLCEQKITSAGGGDTKSLEEHLHAYYRDSRKHHDKVVMLHQWQPQLKTNAWQLIRHGIELTGSKFQCTLCTGPKATDLACNVFEHIATKAHQEVFRAQNGRDAETLLSVPPNEKETAPWEESFREAEQLHKETAVAPAFLQAVEDLKKATATAGREGKAGSAATGDQGATASADPVAAAAAAVADVPVARPGLDFPCWPSSGEPLDWSNADIDSLKRQADELWLEESISAFAPTLFWCDFCEHEVPEEQLVQHVRSAKSRGGHHNRNKKLAFDLVNELKTRGWELQQQGISLARTGRQSTYSCKFCGISNQPWYAVLQHIDENKHQTKARAQGVERCNDQSPEAASKRQQFSDEISEMLVEMQGCYGCQVGKMLKAVRLEIPVEVPVAAASAASSSSMEPQQKRRRTAPAAAAAAAAEAASTTTAGAKPSQWLVGTELATQQEVDEGKEKAKQTGYPPMPKDLAYIRFKKGKGFHVQCCACQVVIGFAKLGGDGELSCDDDGNCPHWNPDSKRKLEEEAHRMHNEWATARRR